MSNYDPEALRVRDVVIAIVCIIGAIYFGLFILPQVRWVMQPIYWSVHP